MSSRHVIDVYCENIRHRTHMEVRRRKKIGKIRVNRKATVRSLHIDDIHFAVNSITNIESAAMETQQCVLFIVKLHMLLPT